MESKGILMEIKCRIKAGTIDDYLVVARQFVRETRNEPGCLGCDLVGEATEPDVLVYMVRWNDEVNLAAHNSGKVFNTYIPLMGEYLEACDTREYQIYE